MSKFCIYGYGAEGQSTEKFFQENPEFEIQIFDEKTHPKVPDWDSIDLIFLSPGISPEKVPETHRAKITNQLNWFLKNLADEQRSRVIGITGSKGKTTTTIMTTAWLESEGFNVAYAGNIGHPIFEIYSDFIQGAYDYIILEISSFQAEIMQYSPGIGIFLGLFPDHLDRHGDIANYEKAKSRLWAHQTEKDALITTPLGLTSVKKHQGKGQLEVSEALEKDYFPQGHVFQADHFRQNLGTIKSLSKVLKKDFNKERFRKVVEALEMPEHRLEFVAKKKDILFYNDAIASNPEAVVAAIKFFGEDLGTLILGGTDSGGEFHEVLTTLKNKSPQAQIVITDSPILPRVKSAAENFPSLKINIEKNLDEALKKCLELTSKNKVCLLSPGGKSFDQFPNYSTKGRYFKSLVEAL